MRNDDKFFSAIFSRKCHKNRTQKWQNNFFPVNFWEKMNKFKSKNHKVIVHRAIFQKKTKKSRVYIFQRISKNGDPCNFMSLSRKICILGEDRISASFCHYLGLFENVLMRKIEVAHRYRTLIKPLIIIMMNSPFERAEIISTFVWSEIKIRITTNPKAFFPAQHRALPKMRPTTRRPWVHSVRNNSWYNIRNSVPRKILLVTSYNYILYGAKIILDTPIYSKNT